MYTEVLRHASADTALLISRSFALMMLTPPRLDLALQDTDVAIQHNPTSWQAWLQRGETLLRKGDVTGAEKAFLNAVGFAQGPDRLPARRSLTDARARRRQISPTAAAKPSRTSVQSTVPTQTSAPSLPTTPPLHTPFVTQVSSMQTSRPSLPKISLSHTSSVTQIFSTSNPITTMSNSTQSIPPNTQPSGKLTPSSYSKPICSNWNPIKEELLRMALISRNGPLSPLQHQSRAYHSDSKTPHQKLLQATLRNPPIQIPQSGFCHSRR
jgi:hypothetical protein